jgi:hypothetical protein
MTHSLRQPNPNSPWGAPLVVGLRYQCQCGDREVLNIQCVIDLGVPESIFVETVKRLREDVLFEVEQHIKAAKATA